MVNTIGVSKGEKLSLFRCPNCGSGVCQVLGQVVKIYPMVEPSSEVMTIHRCQECKTLYNFQTRVSSNKTIRVKLFRNNLPDQVWYCHTCRTPLLRIMDDKIVNLNDRKILELPVYLTCGVCLTNYDLLEVLK